MISGGKTMGIGRLSKRAVSIGMVAAFLAALAVALAPSGADAAPVCTLSIINCGCVINTPGTYTLSGASPMTSTGTCVDITASKVTLVGGPLLKGPGSTTATYGVHVEASANKVILESIEAEDFGQGFHIDGPNASAIALVTTLNGKGTVVSGANAFLIEAISEEDNFVGIQVNPGATNFVMVVGEAISESGVGIFLNGVNGAFLTDAISEGDGSFGIWLKSSSNNVISGFVAESNNVAGVYLGCNAAGPSDIPCPAGVPSSNGNSFMGPVYGSSTNSIVSSTGTPFHQHFGIAVDVGNLHNHFVTITGTGNLNEDAIDENPNCGNNRWFANNFTSSVPAKNTTLFCLN